jgi:putative transposase
MPWGLHRFQKSEQLHFVTFSCYHRLPKLATGQARSVFERSLEQTRLAYVFYVLGYVVMPEHVHLPLTEPHTKALSSALQALKQSVSRTLALRTAEPLWQTRYYDFNVFTEEKRIEKLRYMHRKSGPPDARALCVGVKIRLSAGWLLGPKSGPGRASGITRRVSKARSRSNRNGRRESANSWECGPWFAPGRSSGSGLSLHSSKVAENRSADLQIGCPEGLPALRDFGGWPTPTRMRVPHPSSAWVGGKETPPASQKEIKSGGNLPAELPPQWQFQEEQ